MTTGISYETNLIRLQSAVLCANCELISQGANGHCAACGSQALLSLSRILGGPLEAEMTFAFEGSGLVVENHLNSGCAFVSAA